MDICIMIATLLANIVAIGTVYYFIKKLDTRKKIIFIAFSVAIMYILISIIYWLSGFEIDENIHKQAQDFIVFLFVPINVILFMPYLAKQYMKLLSKKIKKEKLAKKVTIVIILLIIVLTIECIYFKTIQNNIINLNNTKAENTIVNEKKSTNTLDNELSNQIINETTNNIKSNQIINETTNNIKSNQIINETTNNIKLNQYN